MFGEALVCECGNPLYRVYNNPYDVTAKGFNDEKLVEQFYYICSKCLIPRLTSQSEQDMINDFF